MELIRWMRQQGKKIKNSWIQSKIYERGLIFRSISKKYLPNKKQLKKKKHYKEPNSRKKKFNRREQMRHD